MAFEIQPLSDALGAEIIGLDVSKPLAPETFTKVHQAHLDHLVVVFRDQDLTPQQQINFSKCFGPLDRHPADDAVVPAYPDILVVSTKRENGKYKVPIEYDELLEGFDEISSLVDAPRTVDKRKDPELSQLLADRLKELTEFVVEAEGAYTRATLTAEQVDAIKAEVPPCIPF